MRSNTRFTVFVAGAFAVVALASGCSSGDTATSSENTEVCTSFAADHNEFVGLATAGPGTAEGLETWTTSKDAAIAKLDALPANASGAVADSLKTFTDALPEETLDLSDTDSESGKAFNSNATGVASACEADGTTITLDELPLVTFTN